MNISKRLSALTAPFFLAGAVHAAQDIPPTPQTADYKVIANLSTGPSYFGLAANELKCAETLGLIFNSSGMKNGSGLCISGNAASKNYSVSCKTEAADQGRQQMVCNVGLPPFSPPRVNYVPGTFSDTKEPGTKGATRDF